MTDAVIISLISATASTLAAAMALWNNYLGRKNSEHIARTAHEVSETREAMATLEKNTNSIKDALVKVTAESEYAKGLKAGTEALS